MLPCFSDDDDGIPPGCRNRKCPLDHRNKWFNDNSYARKLGEIGFSYFDVYRINFFGFASYFTLATIVITVWGCFALSTDSDIVQRTYWAGGTGKNLTTNLDYTMYIGLRSIVYVPNCGMVHAYQEMNDACIKQTIFWNSDECNTGNIKLVTQICMHQLFICFFLLYFDSEFVI